MVISAPQRNWSSAWRPRGTCSPRQPGCPRLPSRPRWTPWSTATYGRATCRYTHPPIQTTFARAYGKPQPGYAAISGSGPDCLRAVEEHGDPPAQPPVARSAGSGPRPQPVRLCRRGGPAGTANHAYSLKYHALYGVYRVFVWMVVSGSAGQRAAGADAAAGPGHVLVRARAGRARGAGAAGLRRARAR